MGIYSLLGRDNDGVYVDYTINEGYVQCDFV